MQHPEFSRGFARYVFLFYITYNKSSLSSQLVGWSSCKCDREGGPGCTRWSTAEGPHQRLEKEILSSWSTIWRSATDRIRDIWRIRRVGSRVWCICWRTALGLTCSFRHWCRSNSIGQACNRQKLGNIQVRKHSISGTGTSGQRYPLFKQPAPGCLFEAKTFNFFMKRVCSCLDLALTLVSENEIPNCHHSYKVYQQYFNVELFRMLFYWLLRWFHVTTVIEAIQNYFHVVRGEKNAANLVLWIIIGKTLYMIPAGYAFSFSLFPRLGRWSAGICLLSRLVLLMGPR